MCKHVEVSLRGTMALCREVHGRFKSIAFEHVKSLREDDALTTHNVSQNAERLKMVMQALRLHASLIWVLKLNRSRQILRRPWTFRHSKWMNWSSPTKSSTTTCGFGRLTWPTTKTGSERLTAHYLTARHTPTRSHLVVMRLLSSFICM